MSTLPPDLSAQRDFLRVAWTNQLPLSQYTRQGLIGGSVISFARETAPDAIRAFEMAKAVRVEVGAASSATMYRQKDDLATQLSQNLQIVIENLPAIMNAAAPYLLPELLADFTTLQSQTRKLAQLPTWAPRADALSAALGKEIPPIFKTPDFLDKDLTLWPWRPVVAGGYRQNAANGPRAKDWEVASRTWENEARFGALAIAAQLRGGEKTLALETIPHGVLDCLQKAPADMRGMWMVRCAFEVLPEKHRPVIMVLAKTLWDKYQPELTTGVMRDKLWVVKGIWQDGPLELRRIIDPNTAALPPLGTMQKIFKRFGWGKDPRG